MNVLLIYVVLVLFAATIVRSAFGFGEALFAVPLLALRIPVEVAVPLAVLVSVAVAGTIVAQDWRSIHIGSAGWLLVPALFGIPIGLLLLKFFDPHVVKAILGGIIISFSLYSLIGRAPITLEKDNWFWLLACGFCSGITGGAFGMNGPPLVIYGAMRRWPPRHFRATLQGYFFPASIMVMIGYGAAGLWSAAVVRYFLLSLPAIIVAIFIGRSLNSRLSAGTFLKYVYLGLVATGALLLAQAAHGK